MRCFSFCLICLLGAVAAAAEWTIPQPEAVQSELRQYLKQETELPDALAPDERFEAVIRHLRQASEPIRQYLDQCDAFAWRELPFGKPLTLPQVPLQIHQGDSPTKYLDGAMRYYLARRLMQARLYDEAKAVLDLILPEQCIDPAGVLLLKAVAAYHLSDKESGQECLKEFQKIRDLCRIPRRSAELAKLLQFEWDKESEQKERSESQQISQKMNDIRRRLEKGKTDDGTQQAEKGVLDSLDKLIEKIEEQARKQGGQQGSGGQSNNPAEESVPMAQKGPGNVDRRDFSPESHWGDMPPKEREEVIMQIEKEFPAYYRDIIEQYFRELAK